MRIGRISNEVLSHGTKRHRLKSILLTLPWGLSTDMCVTAKIGMNNGERMQCSDSPPPCCFQGPLKCLLGGQRHLLDPLVQTHDGLFCWDGVTTKAVNILLIGSRCQSFHRQGISSMPVKIPLIYGMLKFHEL